MNERHPEHPEEEEEEEEEWDQCVPGVEGVESLLQTLPCAGAREHRSRARRSPRPSAFSATPVCWRARLLTRATDTAGSCSVCLLLAEDEEHRLLPLPVPGAGAGHDSRLSLLQSCEFAAHHSAGSKGSKGYKSYKGLNSLLLNLRH